MLSEFRKATELSPELLLELAISPRTHFRVKILLAILYVLALFSLSNGFSVAYFSASSMLFPYFFPDFSQIGIVISNLITMSLVLADFYWSFRLRNLLQPLPSNSKALFHLVFVPLSVTSVVCIFMAVPDDIMAVPDDNKTTIKHLFLRVMDASTACLQLLLMLFVASARHSCDTGEKLHQTLLRYAALVFSVVGLFNCVIFQLTNDHIVIFRKAFVNAPPAATTNPIQELSFVFEPVSHKVVYLCNLVGIFLLLQPLAMQWRLLQQRLNSVKMIPDPRPQSPLPERRYCRWQTGIVWSCAVVLGSLYGLGFFKFQWLSILVDLVMTMTTVFFLVRLQDRILLRNQLRAEQWLNIDNFLICIGLLGQMGQLISQGQQTVQCHAEFFTSYFFRSQLIADMTQVLSQGILLFILSQLSKQNWTLLPPQRIDGILNPLPMFLLKNLIVFLLIDLFRYPINFYYSCQNPLLFYAYGLSLVSMPGCTLFTIHSIYVIVRFMRHK